MNYQNSWIKHRCSVVNLKTLASAAASMPFASKKYADRYLGAFRYRFIGGSIWRQMTRACGSCIWASCQARPEATPEGVAEFAT